MSSTTFAITTSPLLFRTRQALKTLLNAIPPIKTETGPSNGVRGGVLPNFLVLKMPALKGSGAPLGVLTSKNGHTSLCFAFRIYGHRGEVHFTRFDARKSE